MKPRVLLRLKATLEKFACGKTKFNDDIRWHSDIDPYVTGTTIPRLRPVPMGPKVVAFFEHEADEILDALAALRDASPAQTRTTRVSLRDALPPKLERERRDLIERRAALRAQLSGDADPEIREQIELIDRDLRALDGRSGS
jgi:hypothetical protein